MTALEGPDALLAIIDDLTARLAKVEKVVHDGDKTAGEIRAKEVNLGVGALHAGQVTADDLDVGGDVLCRVLRVNAGPDSAHATIEASHDFVQLKLHSSSDPNRAATVNLTATEESGDGMASMELYRRGNGLGGFTVFDDNPTGPVLWMHEADEHDMASADEKGEVGAKDLARLAAPLPSPTVRERVAELEAWRAEMAQEVTTLHLVADSIDTCALAVQGPSDPAPTVMLTAGADGILVGNGTGTGPHVTIGADRHGGDIDNATGRRVPEQAAICLWADEETPGLAFEASRGHPGRPFALGGVEVAHASGQGPALRLDDSVSVTHPGGGRVDIGAGSSHADLYLRSADHDKAGTIGLFTSRDFLDERGRVVDDSSVLIRHGDQEAVVLSASGVQDKPTSGRLAITDGARERVVLDVRRGQAGVDVLSPTGDDITIDAGPDGAALAIRRPDACNSPLWIDRNGVRPR